MRTETYSFSPGGQLDLEFNCMEVDLEVRTASGFVEPTVEVSAEDEFFDKLDISKGSNDLRIGLESDIYGDVQINHFGSSVSVIGGSFSGSMVVNSGGVFVDGVRIDTPGRNVPSYKGSTKITVKVTKSGNTPLRVRTQGQTELSASDIDAHEVELETSGQSTQTMPSIRAERLEVTTGGQSSITAHNVVSRRSRVTSGGQSQIRLDSTEGFGEIRAESGGQSSVDLHGPSVTCDAEASGQSRVYYRGRMERLGRQRSGRMAHVDVIPL